MQRSTNFGTENVPIPFEVTRLNVGNAMNVASGIFTAPKTGIYFFSFSGLGSAKRGTFPQLYLNGNLMGSGWAGNFGSSDGADDIPTFSRLPFNLRFS